MSGVLHKILRDFQARESATVKAVFRVGETAGDGEKRYQRPVIWLEGDHLGGDVAWQYDRSLFGLQIVGGEKLIFQRGLLEGMKGRADHRDSVMQTLIPGDRLDITLYFFGDDRPAGAADTRINDGHRQHLGLPLNAPTGAKMTAIHIGRHKPDKHGDWPQLVGWELLALSLDGVDLLNGSGPAPAPPPPAPPEPEPQPEPPAPGPWRSSPVVAFLEMEGDPTVMLADGRSFWYDSEDREWSPYLPPVPGAG